MHWTLSAWQLVAFPVAIWCALLNLPCLLTLPSPEPGFVAETEDLAAEVEDAMYPAMVRPSTSALPQTLGKPPPLLPTPGRNPILGQSAVPSAKPALLGERPLGGLLPTPGW